MALQFVRISEKTVDKAGKLRVRVVCDNDGLEASFFIKIHNKNATNPQIADEIREFVRRWREDKQRRDSVQYKHACPHCQHEV